MAISKAERKAYNSEWAIFEVSEFVNGAWDNSKTYKTFGRAYDAAYKKALNGGVVNIVGVRYDSTVNATIEKVLFTTKLVSGTKGPR